MRGIVYIAGPMTLGPRDENLSKALEAAEKVWALGFAPFVPQLHFFYGDHFYHTWEEWLAYDETILTFCCALFRIDGESKGADREEAFAYQKDIPVFFDYSAFEKWSQSYISPLVKYWENE